MLIVALFCIILGVTLRFFDKYPLLDLLLYGIGAILLCNYLYSDIPTAMDVYKGKTTLEITYKDNIPIDSVVMFKDKEK